MIKASSRRGGDLFEGDFSNPVLYTNFGAKAADPVQIETLKVVHFNSLKFLKVGARIVFSLLGRPANTYHESCIFIGHRVPQL